MEEKRFGSRKAFWRRSLILLLAVWAGLFAFFPVGTEAKEGFPEKPVTFIVPFGSGSGTDLFARAIQPHAAKYLGAPIVIENIPAGNTIVGYTKLNEAKPDGYTFSSLNLPSVFVHKLQYNPPFDPLKFTPIAGWADTPLVVATHPEVFPDFKKFMETARQRKLSVASQGGVGSSAWLMILLIEKETGVEFNKVPYTTGEGNVQVAGKHLDAVVTTSAPILSLVKSGRLKPVAALYHKRDLLYPEVPTTKEMGYKLPAITTHRGVVGPPDMPQDIVKVLESAFLKAAKDPEYAAWTEKRNILVDPLSSEEYGQRLKEVYQSIEPLSALFKKK